MRPTRSLCLASLAACAAFPAGATQLVLLEFDRFTDGDDIRFSTFQRDQVQSRMEVHYNAFDFAFTQADPGPGAGPFSTIFFNDGPQFGIADDLDFRNINRGDNATVQISGNGLSEAQEVTLAANVASHELGHLQGLRHGDSFGPIGSGIDPGTVNRGDYLPAYDGPAEADETRFHLMETDDVFLEADADQFFSERSAVRLSFNERGTVSDEVATPHGDAATAQPLTLPTISVPNTLGAGADNAGLQFFADAEVVTATLGSASEEDWYSFIADAGDLFNFETISNSTDRIADDFDTQLTLYDADGISQLMFNDDEFETRDSILLDAVIPAAGTYFVRVNGFSGTGGYELFGHRFRAVVPEPTSLAVLAVLGLAAGRRRGRESPARPSSASDTGSGTAARTRNASV